MATTNRWKQERFYISTFNATGTDPQYWEAQLQYHKDTGFNLIEFTFKSREDVLACLEICERLALRSLVQDMEFAGIGTDHPTVSTDDIVREAVARYAPFSQLLGYYVWDEPGLETLSLCGDTTRRFRRYAPDKLAFSVMVPSYGVYAWQANDTWSGDTPIDERPYARYVRRYLEETDCDVASVDYYPFAMSKEARLIENDMWRDMGCVRHYAKEAGRPFWYYFQGKWDFPLSDDEGGKEMTYERLAVQAFAALAYGAKALSYFTSSSLVSVSDDKKGPLYDEVKRLNHKLMHLGTVLLNKTSDHVIHTGLDNKWNEPYFLDTAADIPWLKSAPARLIAGSFTDGSDSHYLLFVNKDFEAPTDGVVQLDAPHAVDVFNDNSGEWESLTVADRFSLWLAPGEGRLFRLTPTV